MKRPFPKLFRRLLFAVAAFVGLCASGIALFFIRCSSPQTHFDSFSFPANPNRSATELITNARPLEDTFFTYPEWYIVWSYQEKADFQQRHLPASFPYFADIGQYWCGYCAINRMVIGRYPFNFGDHLMLMVIGSSFTAEYTLKALYEKTLGRLSEWTSGGEPVEEDLYAAQVARQYADFVHIRPFYEFSFWRSLVELWRTISLWGPHPIRKWERKVFLSLDYAIESAYCELLTLPTHLTYGVESADTHAVIQNPPSAVLYTNPHIKLVHTIGPEAAFVIIPRYQEFTETAERLAQAGAQFTDVEGNTEILISAILPAAVSAMLPGSQAVFAAKIPTTPDRKRVLFRTPIASLSSLLNTINARGWEVEHVYDF